MQQTADRPLKYDSYHDPVRALSAGCLEAAVVEYTSFGAKRYRQRYLYGRDWKREHDKKPNFTPEIYKKLRILIAWLYTFQFGAMCEILEYDHEIVRDRLLELMSGEYLNEPMPGN